jgi:hypothetical protein
MHDTTRSLLLILLSAAYDSAEMTLLIVRSDAPVLGCALLSRHEGSKAP